MPSDVVSEVSRGPDGSGPDVDDRAAVSRLNRRGMAKFALFVVVNAIGLVLAVALAAKLGERNRFPVGKSESVLLTIPEDTHYDVLIVGPSHAQEFSWSGNHERVEEILGADVANLSSEGTGPVPVDIFWKIWRERGNTADTVLYVAHPFAFYSSRFNEDNRFTGKEPIDPTMLSEMIDRGFGTDNVMFYFQSKFNPVWVVGKPRADNGELEVGSEPIEPDLLEAAVGRLYPDGTDNDAFEKYAAVFDETVREMRDAGMRVVIMIPPTLMGEPDGLEAAAEHFEGLARSDDGITFLDLTGVIEDHSEFLDLSHLNTAGVVHLTREYLEPALAVQAEE